MSPLALGIWEDLRRRRLLPVAILLLVCAVVLPLVALKPAKEPPAKPAAAASTAAQTVDGLPSPEAALSDKPLVSLAVLDEPSDLGEFESKDPFKPIEQVSADGASDSASDSASGGGSGGSAIPAAALGAAGSGGSASAGGGDSGSSGGGSGGGSSTPASPAPQPAPKQDGGGSKPSPTPAPAPAEKLTYTVDLSIRGPKGLRRYRGVPKLTLLPSQNNPLLVFLGVEEAGTKAVFLVDATLKSVAGEGTCTPSPEQCATLAMAPGEEHVLANDQGLTWTILIDEVRETTVKKAAAAARRVQARHARDARDAREVAGRQPVPRFVAPVFVDLFTGGRS